MPAVRLNSVHWLCDLFAWLGIFPNYFRLIEWAETIYRLSFRFVRADDLNGATWDWLPFISCRSSPEKKIRERWTDIVHVNVNSNRKDVVGMMTKVLFACIISMEQASARSRHTRTKCVCVCVYCSTLTKLHLCYSPPPTSLCQYFSYCQSAAHCGLCAPAIPFFSNIFCKTMEWNQTRMNWNT